MLHELKSTNSAQLSIPLPRRFLARGKSTSCHDVVPTGSLSTARYEYPVNVNVRYIHSNTLTGYGQGQQYPATPQYGQQQQHYPPPPGQGSHPQQSAYPPQHQQSYGQPSYASYGQPPSSGPTHQSAVPEASDSGSYRNLNWTVKHRNTNSTLNVQLGQGDIIKSKAGAMIHMSPTVTLQGKMKVSMKKLFTGGSMTESSYTGPGLVALAPTLFGDIVTLQIQQGSTWNVGKDAYLASTNDVVKDTKSQGLGKAFFSGEDLFIYNFTGEGVAWLTSFGAIETKHVSRTACQRRNEGSS